MKVAIIGCGKISDEHAWLVQTIPGAELVGVCDREELMAKQMAERFQIPCYATEAVEMLERARPDVVHITTSPQSHFDLGRLCLERNCHILIEKPFTVTAEEAETLVELAEARGKKLTAGHDNQFSSAAMEMRRLTAAGFLGGQPVHMESLFPYDISDERYARALLANRTHWVRRLPGLLAHNVISHGISKIAEFLKGEMEITALGFPSKMLKKVGEKEILDEIRVVIRDEFDTTAYFTFSSQISPGLHQLRLHGPKNSLVVDYTHQVVLPLYKKTYKSYLNQFVPPLLYGKALLGGGLRNIGLFLRRELHQDTGRRNLVSSFYAAINSGGPVPIPYEEIIRTARIMDEIFEQISVKPSLRGAEREIATAVQLSS